MKIVMRTILIILITILLIFNIPTYSKGISLDDIISYGDSFLTQPSPSSGTVAGTIDEDDMEELSNMVSGVLLTIAIAITLISAVVMGINFAIQSVEDKAKIKESMIPWVIGIFVSFGAYGIWRITIEVFIYL